MDENGSIESLTLEINARSEGAEKAVDKLISTLERLQTKTANLGLGNVGTQLNGIRRAAAGFGEKEAAGLERILGALDRLQNVSTIKISSSIANQLTGIANAAGNINGMDFSGIERLSKALSGLAGVGQVNISSALNQLNRIPKIAESLNGVDIGNFAAKIREVTDALKPLAEQMEKVSKGFAAFPDKLQRVIQETDRIPKSNGKAAASYALLAGKVGLAVAAIRRILRTVLSWVDLANDQVETLNLFNVAMGRYAEESGKYAEAVGDTLGIDPVEWMRGQGVLMTLATGFGIAGDKAANMSSNLTKLAYDLSSFYNISTTDAFQKVQSGLAGEIEPMRRLGFDLSNAALQQIAYANGIDKTVSSMTQAEKASLRYYAMMTQVTQTHGDLARTINSPANQLRRLKTAVTEAARAIGNLLVPVLQLVVPWLIASANAVTDFAESLALLLNIKGVDQAINFEDIVGGAEGTEEAIEGATEAAGKFRKMLLGIDELNVLNEKTASGLGGSIGLPVDIDPGDFDLWGELFGEDGPELNPLAITIKDVFFDWENLSGEDILKKLIVGLGAVLGAAAGLSIGGLKGGLLGLALGTALTLLLSSVIFDHDGKISGEELIQSLYPILGAIAGLVVGKSAIGGLIGLGIGTAITFLLRKYSFEEDGTLNAAELLQGILPVLGAIAGFVITKAPAGALIGLGIGTAVSLLINHLSVDPETGDFSGGLDTLKDIVARAFAGAGIGFIATGGNLGGALIGASIGTAVSLALNSLGFNGEKFGNQDLAKGLLSLLAGFGGALIKFAVGGTAGGILGATVALGLGFLVNKVDWQSVGERVTSVSDFIRESFRQASEDTANNFARMGDSVETNFTGPATDNVNLFWWNFGNAMAQASSRTDTSFVKPMQTRITDLFAWIEEKTGLTTANIVESFGTAKAETDLAYILPTQEGFTNLFNWLGEQYILNKDAIVKMSEDAMFGQQELYLTPTRVNFTDLFSWWKQKFDETRQGIVTNFGSAKNNVMSNFISPMRSQASSLANNMKAWFRSTCSDISNAFKTAAANAKSAFQNLASWFQTNVVSPIKNKLAEIRNAINSVINSVTNAFNKVKNKSPNTKPKNPYDPFGNGNPFDNTPDWLKNYGTGGFPSVGEMFVARERGPELVGRIGNQSAVANNNQIIAGIKQGVYEAMMASNGGNGTPVFKLYVGGKQLMTAVAEEARRETVRTGVNPLTQGG